MWTDYAKREREKKKYVICSMKTRLNQDVRSSHKWTRSQVWFFWGFFTCVEVRKSHAQTPASGLPASAWCLCVCVWFPHTDGGVCLPPSLSHVLQSCSIISHECRQACFFNCPVPRRLKRISRDFMALHQFLMPCCNSGPYTLFMGTVCYSGTDMS